MRYNDGIKIGEMCMDELTLQDISKRISRTHFGLITTTWLSRLHYPKNYEITG